MAWVPGWMDPGEERQPAGPWTPPPLPGGPGPMLPSGPGPLGPGPARQVDPGTMIPPLGPTDVQAGPQREWEPPEEMDWHKLRAKVSPDTMAQLFAYWRDETPMSGAAQGELLGAGLDWWWGWGPGDPRRYFKRYAHDLENMYDRALRQSGYQTRNTYVPRLGREVSQTLGPWYNYGRYRSRY